MRKKKTKLIKKIKVKITEGISQEICAGIAKEWIELHASFSDQYGVTVDEE